MRDRSKQILQIACLTLAALVLLQLVSAFFQASQLAGVKIPLVPTLETNMSSAASPAAKMQTSALTNAVVVQQSAGTNPIATNAMMQIATSNLVAGANPASSSNLVAIAKIGATNLPDVVPSNTQTPASTNLPATQKNDGSNSCVTLSVEQLAANTNSSTGTNFVAADTNNISRKNLSPSKGMAGRKNSGGSMMPGMPVAASDLPPEIQARVDRIVNSEIFAPVMHPLPMGLLGIAGDTAFLRTAGGQTGLVKAGDSLGDLKLLQIGVNRVLVEQDGQKKELTIFDGYGGDPLLPKQDENSK